MGTIQIKKVARKVTIGKIGQERQKVEKTYGKIIYRGTLKMADMVEHIAKHGTVYTEDVVIGVITKLKNCIQEMLADGYKVKLDGIGTLYPVLTSEGAAALPSPDPLGLANAFVTVISFSVLFIISMVACRVSGKIILSIESPTLRC